MIVIKISESFFIVREVDISIGKNLKNEFDLSLKEETNEKRAHVSGKELQYMRLVLYIWMHVLLV